MIEVIKVDDRISGNNKAHELLAGIVDKKTLLVISGGLSPDFDKLIIHPGDILPGAVCLGDERFGQIYHEESNELRIKNSGLNDFLVTQNIEYFRILSGDEAEVTARNYNRIIVDLFSKFEKKVGIMGVGADLHTSAIFPNSVATKSPDFVVVETVEDRIPKRITLTLKALGQFTNFVILMFGEAKEEALRRLLDEGEVDMQGSPAIFYRKSKIKSFLITDIEL